MNDVLPKIEEPVSPRSVTDALRAVIAGGGAAKVLASSAALFEAGGKLLLDEATRSAVRGVLRIASKTSGEKR